jgi:hypothetical protein
MSAKAITPCSTSTVEFIKNYWAPLLGVITGVALAVIMNSVLQEPFNQQIGILVGCNVIAFSLVGFLALHLDNQKKPEMEERSKFLLEKNARRDRVAALATFLVLSLDCFGGCLWGGCDSNMITLGCAAVAQVLLASTVSAYFSKPDKKNSIGRKSAMLAAIAICIEYAILGGSLGKILAGAAAAHFALVSIAYYHLKDKEKHPHATLITALLGAALIFGGAVGAVYTNPTLTYALCALSIGCFTMAAALYSRKNLKTILGIAFAALLATTTQFTIAYTHYDKVLLGILGGGLGTTTLFYTHAKAKEKSLKMMHPHGH